MLECWNVQRKRTHRPVNIIKSKQFRVQITLQRIFFLLMLFQLCKSHTAKMPIQKSKLRNWMGEVTGSEKDWKVCCEGFPSQETHSPLSGEFLERFAAGQRWAAPHKPFLQMWSTIPCIHGPCSNGSLHPMHHGPCSNPGLPVGSWCNVCSHEEFSRDDFLKPRNNHHLFFTIDIQDVTCLSRFKSLWH